MIETVTTTVSTNADMLVRAAAGAPEGAWLRAVEQTGGRGRLGRRWESPRGNLYTSTIIRIRPTDPVAYTLAFVVGLAVFDTVHALCPASDIQLKWPNDIMAGDAKLGGILLERQGDAVIAGIGVNVAAHIDVPGRRTVSFRELGLAETIDAGMVLTILAEKLPLRLIQWRVEGQGVLLDNWQAHGHKLGDRLAVNTAQNRRIEGCYAGLAPDGALRIALDDGTVEVIGTGDVELLR